MAIRIERILQSGPQEPDSAPPSCVIVVLMNDPWIEKISRACGYLANVERGHVSLATLARRIGGSPYHLQRNFKRIVGVTPREYADACRLRTVKRRLRESDAVTAAVFDAGYGSSSRFYERAAPKLGMSPTTYRRGGAGMSINYAVVDSCLGRLLVAATSRGVCSVAMGKSDRDLERVLTDEYPAASIARDDGALAQWTRAIVAHLDGRRPRLDLPIDVRRPRSSGRSGRRSPRFPAERRGRTPRLRQRLDGRAPCARSVMRARSIRSRF